MFPLLLGTFPRLFFYCLSAISNSFLQLNEEGQQEVEFHLHLKDVVHVGSSINQRLKHLLLQRKVNCNQTQTFHSLVQLQYLRVVEVAGVNIELNRKVAFHSLLQFLHRLNLLGVQWSPLTGIAPDV